jgi:hypothetical protein
MIVASCPYDEPHDRIGATRLAAQKALDLACDAGA